MRDERWDAAQSRRERAAQRADEVRARIEALRDRRFRLASGAQPTDADVAASREAAAEEFYRAVEAHRLTAASHREDSQTHRALADALDKLGEHARAEAHRQAAMTADQAAIDDARAADDAEASGGQF